MVLHHQQRTGKPFEAESIAAWCDSCANGTGAALDIGAYTGLYSLLAAKNGCSVVAFEPNEKVYARFAENVSLNPFPDTPPIVLNNTAVSSISGEVSMSISRSVALTSGGTIVEGVGIKSVTIDSLAIDAPIVAIKIDVEGHELEVINGAIATITTHMPLIITEALTEQALRAQRHLLEPLGYQFTKADEWNIIWRASHANG